MKTVECIEIQRIPSFFARKVGADHVWSLRICFAEKQSA
jgi:hypothetical protein